MATRDKKLSVGRKQSSSSPLPPKDDNASVTGTSEESVLAESGDNEETITIVTLTEQKTPNSTQNQTAAVTTTKSFTQTPRSHSIARKLATKCPVKKITKKPQIRIQLKAKRTKNPQIKPKVIKAMLTNPKNVETKKKLLKNCARQPRPKTAKTVKTDESLPPVLEPIFPLEENVDDNNKAKKKAKRPPKIEKIKLENSERGDQVSADIIKAKRVNKRVKPKIDTTAETIEDVIKDLTSCLKAGETKDEPEILSDSGKQTKKVSKRKRKENIENTLTTKFSASDCKVIDMLDLNVNKIKEGLPPTKRRHSIEKFPIGNLDSDVTNNQITIFNNLPRSISPRSNKNVNRVRQTVDGLNRRPSPYKTRSDSPARILRNGKHRKLKDAELLDGLEPTIFKRRRRNCSEFSGSEMSLSKLSGYESDSSFSDLSSLHGGTENSESKDLTSEGVKNEGKDVSELGEEALTPESLMSKEPLAAIIKRSISTDINTPTDTNSNFCDNLNAVGDATVKSENGSPSTKVPDKSLILDIMKQNFNDTLEDKDKDKKDPKSKTKKQADAVDVTMFYGNQDSKESVENPEVKEQISEKPTPGGKEVVEESHVNGCSLEPEKLDEESLVEEIIEINGVSSKEDEVSVNLEERPPEQIVEVKDADEEVKFIEDDHTVTIEETPENLAIKENILQALGLQSLKAAQEAKLLKDKEKAAEVTKNENSYTGTLKTVIKINRDNKKRGKNLKMTLHKNRGGGSGSGAGGTGGGVAVNVAVKNVGETEAGLETIQKEGPSSSWKHSGQSSDTAGAQRKSHYSNRSNMDGSSEHTSDGEAGSQDGPTKALVIPEKASSFSIHPGRLCKDECSYCFGKFGLFDTPCHIAQMKSVERQNKILEVESHLTRDSCLCDACYRHVDRKANLPSYTSKTYKKGGVVAPGPKQDHCHVLGCRKMATNILRRKWIIKMKKSICDMINIDLDNPGLHSIPICDDHYSMLEHLMVCAMCKRRLAKNHVHYLGPETLHLNSALNAEGIPLILSDKPVVCKLCKYFAAIILKPIDERPENSTEFFLEYKKRLLHFNDIVPMDEAAAEEPITVPTKDKNLEKEHPKKKKRITKPQSSETNSDLLLETEKSDQSRVPSSDSTTHSRPESPSDYMVDYNTLIPTIAMECGSDSETSKKDLNTNLTNNKSNRNSKVSRPESVKQAVEISKHMKYSKGSSDHSNSKSTDFAVQRLGSNPSISVRQLFPCEEDLPLQGHIDFGNVREKTPEGWEKCTSIIQYDLETKHLWHDLQKPYGNQSSFLRHLILLEKYFRNGDLILAPNASHHSINYSESVQNRLRAFDNVSNSSAGVPPLSVVAITKSQKSSSGIITSQNNSTNNTKEAPVPAIVNAANIPKNTPITISQLNSNSMIQPRVKPIPAPPGLISLHPGTARPLAPLVKVTKGNKIKFPLPKNWKPNLMPVDPNKKTRKPGLVQAECNGKLYHLTVEDYRKLMAMKNKLEKQKMIASGASKANKLTTSNSVLKTGIPRKSLVLTPNQSQPQSGPLMEQQLIEYESSLEKLDKQVEKLSPQISETKSAAPLNLPKIPKSLTVIPQTVTRKPSRPSSPVVMITQKPKQINKS